MELVQYAKRVIGWWWLIVLCAGIAGAASYVATSRQPSIYQTSATIMVGQVLGKANPTGADFTTVAQLAESYAQIAVRQPILQGAIDRLDLKMGWQDLRWRVNAAPVPRTQLLAITVKDTSPERAVVLANEVAYQLILQSPSSPDNQARQERSEFVQKQLDDLEARIARAQSLVNDLEVELETAFSARQIKELQSEIAGQEDLINTWQANYSGLLAFLQGGGSPNYLTIIEPAQISTVPISPNVRMNVILAAAVGFMLGVGGALVLEYIDDTIKSAEDVSQSLGLTVLSSIGRMKGKDYKGKLIISHDTFSPAVEGYRLLRTNIQFAAIDGPAKSLIVTSPNPGVGKSVTAANLGLIMAQADLKTIIVDSDLRMPSLHQIFQVLNSYGLTDLLRSPELEIGEEYLKYVGIENLQVITSGPLPPNSSEMLGSDRMADLIQRLEKMADVVIFDSPPVLPVTDAVVLSRRVNGAILVIEARRSRRDATRESVKRLDGAGANFLGVVLNRAPSRYAGYYYQYYTRSSARGLPEQVKQIRQRRWWQRLRGLE